jgi:nitrate/nitrite transport system ATP-binding protein
VAVDLARPRDRLEMAHDAKYLECRERVLQFLYRKQGHVEAEAA